VPDSNMPAYAWLARTTLRLDDLPLHLKALRAAGVPYTAAMIENASVDAYDQATPESSTSSGVADRYGQETQVRVFDDVATEVTEMDALVAYLQVLGRLTDAPYKNTAAPQKPPEPVK